MAEPVDPILYRKMKDEVDKSYKKPSAYRSMAYQRFYLKAFAEKYGADKSAFKGKNPKNLGNWRKEKWVDVKTLIADPKNPIACGNAPVGKDEYPLCMPIKEAAKYSEGELKLLVKRKSEIKEKRLVKDAYLRDVLRPEETPAIRKYKEKYITDKKMKIKPLPANIAEKILDEPPLAEELKIKVPKEPKAPKVKEPKAPKVREPKPQVVTIPTVDEPVVEKPRRGRGRPKLSAEQLAANKAAAQAKRKEDRQRASAAFAEERAAVKKQKAEERQRLKDEAKANAPPREVIPKMPVPVDYPTPEQAEEYQRMKVARINYMATRNMGTGAIQYI
jgi:hypothetical protein